MVLDASATVALVLGTAAMPGRAQPRSVAAPEHLHIEAISALRRLTLTGSDEPFPAAAALRRLRALRVETYANLGLLPRIWNLRERLSAYDAAYVALAQQLEAPLMTLDEGMAAVAGSLGVGVIELG